MRPSKFKKPMTHYAKKWGATSMTISNMAKKGCDWDADEKELARWLIANCKRKPAKMTKLIKEILQPTDLNESASKSKAASLEDMREYYSVQLNTATKCKDVNHEAVKFWNDLLLKADESIRKSQAHEKKLGIEKGELLSRSEVERIIKASIWAGNACIDKFSKQIAQRLSNLPPQDVHKALKPQLTGMIIFEGMRRVTKTPGEINVPQWVADCYQTERSLYLEP